MAGTAKPMTMIACTQNVAVYPHAATQAFMKNYTVEVSCKDVEQRLCK